MQPHQRNPHRFWPSVRDELARLDFLSRFFTWVFMLLSRLAEPLMTLSAIYIAVEAGLPRLSLVGLHETAVAVMIAAPEIILPGSFGMAAQARRAGQPYRMLYAVSWAFVALTGLTLLSLFVLHLDAAAFNVITFLRCGAGVSYSILIRVLTHGQPNASAVSVPELLARFTELAEHLARLQASTEQHFTESEQRLGANTERHISASEHRLTEQVQRTLSEHMYQLTERIERTAREHSALHSEHATALSSERQRRAERNPANTPPNVRSLADRPAPRTPKRTANSDTDKGAFVRSCLTETPNIRNSDIQRKAAERGLTISPAYISETRKAFLEEQTTQEDTA